MSRLETRSGIKWGAIVPLIGGQVLGTRRALGCDPRVMFSFPPFRTNDSYIRSYLPDVPFHELDEDVIDSETLSRRGAGIKVMVSTCPCAGLSQLSAAKTNDPVRAGKNRWMLYTTDQVLTHIRPDLLLGENAPSLATGMGMDVVRTMRLMANERGYSLLIAKMTSTMCGIPQNRVRSFYFFVRNKLIPTELTWPRRDCPTVKRYLKSIAGGLVSDWRWDHRLRDSPMVSFLNERLPGWNTDAGKDEHGDRTGALSYIVHHKLVREFCRRFPLREADDYDTIERGEIRAVHRMLKKIKSGSKSGVNTSSAMIVTGDPPAYNAVTAKSGCKIIHPNGKRYLNVRELAQLMGLPNDFELPPRNKWNIICQNVPVNSAECATELGMRLMESGRRVDTRDLLGRRTNEGRDFVLYDFISNRDRTDWWNETHERVIASGKAAPSGYTPKSI